MKGTPAKWLGFFILEAETMLRQAQHELRASALTEVYTEITETWNYN
jgi:hypothetical protein